MPETCMDKITSFLVVIGQYVNIDEWDEVKGKVKKNHPNSSRMNAYVAHRVAEAEAKTIELSLTKKSVQVQEIKEAVKGKKSESFYTYFHLYCDRLNSKGKIGTYRRGISILQKLREYSSDMQLADITPSVAKGFESFLAEKGNNANTIQVNFKFIKSVVNMAIKKGHLSANPFKSITIKSIDCERAYLEEEEISALEGLKLTENSMLYHHRNMYVFSCYCGLRISDLITLRWESFNGRSLSIMVRKTGSQLTIFLPDKGLEMLGLYRTITSDSPYVFPLLEDTQFDELQLFKAISSGTAYANKDLRVLAQKAGINKHLSFHTARHTFAVRALRKGIRIEYVSKLLGHKNIRETQIYAKIVNSDLENAMSRFNI